MEASVLHGRERKSEALSRLRWFKPHYLSAPILQQLHRVQSGDLEWVDVPTVIGGQIVMDNVNDYQALRVKAAFLAINSIWVEPDYDVPDLAKAALKAADSIPLPQESELVEVVARAAWKRDQPEPNDLYETFGDLPDYEQEIYRDEVKPLLQALRPALAAMAGGGVDREAYKKTRGILEPYFPPAPAVEGGERE